MGNYRREGLVGTFLLVWACSGSEFSEGPPPGIVNPSAGSAGATHSPAGGAGGGVIEPGGGAPPSVDGGSGGDGGDPTIEPQAGAGGQPVVEPDCQGMLAGCECVDGRCGPGLACSAEGKCIEVPEPVAHWPLNEDASDASGNGYDGEAHNGVTFDGNAATFDGTDSYVEITSFSEKFKAIAGAFTLYVRVNATSWVTDPILFGSGDVDLNDAAINGFWFVVLDELATVNTETPDTGFNNLVSLGTSLPLDTWLDLVFTINWDAADLYVGGEWVDYKEFVRVDPAAEQMQIGGWLTPGNVLLGAIDDVQVYEGVLEDAQIAALPSRR